MKSFRILVVEENQDLLELIVKYLELCGWRASAANSQEDFWLQLERQRPHLILLDVTISGSGASSLLSEFKSGSRFTDIPVIAMAAMGSIREKNLWIAAGCDRVLEASRFTWTSCAGWSSVLLITRRMNKKQEESQ